MTTLIALALLARPAPETFSSTKGEVDLGKGAVLVVALSPTCPHALNYAPVLSRLAKAVAPGVKLVAFMRRSAKEATAFAKKTKAKFPIVSDVDGKLVSAVGAEHTLDLGIYRDGKLFGTKVGLSRESVKSLLSAGGARLPKDLRFLPAEVVSGCSLG